MQSRVSVIIPMDRPGADADRAVRAVLDQRTEVPFELIVVGPSGIQLPDDPRITQVIEENRNAAIRRNAAAAVAKGTILAFVDDDAFADADWIETAISFLDSRPEVVILGGPDPSPDDASIGERVSDTLLGTPWIGSGVMCHTAPSGVIEVRSGHDLALVNLFVRRDAFERVGGFDESIGYIGEDTDLVAKMIGGGRVMYHAGVVVRHRRRAFPIAYLRQRWRYRVKTGVMMARGRGGYARNPKILGFLGAGLFFFVLAAVSLFAASLLLAFYVVVTLILGSRRTTLPIVWWWTIPLAFACHHATYFAGIVTGLVTGLVRSK